MILQSSCYSIDHRINFKLETGIYQNIITFLELNNILFLSEIKIDFTKIPFLLHGKGKSKNLLEYLENNNQNDELIFKFLKYFITDIVQIKYEFNRQVIFEFIFNSEWQNMNLIIYSPYINITTTLAPSLNTIIAAPYENLDNTLAFSIDGVNWDCEVVTGLEDVKVFYNIFKFGDICFTTCASTEEWDNTWKYSIDGGYSWYNSTIFTLGDNDFVMEVAYNGTLYVAANDNPGVANSILYSENGVDWTGIGNTLLNRCSRVIWDNNKWLAVGGVGVQIVSSNDGTNWSNFSQIITTGSTINDIAFNYSTSSPLYIMSINNGFTDSKMFTSTDAISWIHTATLTQFRWLSNIIYFNNLFVTGGQLRSGGGNQSIIYSSDGITWAGTADGLIDDVYAISKIGDIVVAGGTTGIDMTATSLDGITWLGNGNVCVFDEVDGMSTI